MKTVFFKIMLLLLLALIFIISSVEGVCNADMMEKASKACVLTNINVYQPLQEPSKELEWEAAIAGGAAALGTFFGFGKLNIISFAIGQIANNLGQGSTIGDINKDNIKFQSKVNEALAQVTQCIGEAISDNDALLAKTDFQVAYDNFFELHNVWSKSDQLTDEKYNQLFYDAWNSLSNQIDTHLDNSKAIWTNSGTIKRYIAYLPVFIEAATNYRIISLAYLSHLKQNNLPYTSALTIMRQDAGKLTAWIISAHQKTEENISLNDYTIMDQWNVNDIVGNFEADTCFTTCPIEGKPISVTWGNAMHAGFLAYPISTGHNGGEPTVDWNSITGLTSKNGITVNCQNNIMNCPAYPTDCFMCKTRYYLTDSCKNMIRTVVVNNLNEYRASVTAKLQEFGNYYYTYTTKLNNALTKF